MAEKVRIGIIGAGGIFRTRHFPGLATVEDAEVVAICNRSEASGRKIAEEFGLKPDIMTDPHALIAREDVDAVMVGTWPYMHCLFALEALDAGKHVFVQARMAMNFREAKAMYARGQETGLMTQICPAPHAMRGDWFMRRMVREGYLGQVYHIDVRSMNGSLIDPEIPLHWRQIGRFSGLNTMSLGMLAEYVHRWFGFATSVSAQAETFTQARPLSEGEGTGPVERPDAVNILARMENGAMATYQFSAVAQHGGDDQIVAHGSEGTLVYTLGSHKILGAKAGDKELKELAIPENEVREWTVEQDFVTGVQTGKPAESTFYEGVKYMEFTEAVFRSVERGGEVRLPLVD